jgi:hypothetical protein
VAAGARLWPITRQRKCPAKAGKLNALESGRFAPDMHGAAIMIDRVDPPLVNFCEDPAKTHVWNLTDIIPAGSDNGCPLRPTLATSVTCVTASGLRAASTGRQSLSLNIYHSTSIFWQTNCAYYCIQFKDWTAGTGTLRLSNTP